MMLCQNISNLAPRLEGIKQSKLIIRARVSFSDFICFVSPNILKMACCYCKGSRWVGERLGNFAFRQ